MNSDFHYPTTEVLFMPHRMLKVTLRAAILAFAVSFILIFIFAYAAYCMPDVPDSLITVFAYAALAVGGLLCGIVSSVGNDDNPLIVGSVSGLAYFSLFLICSAGLSLASGCMFGLVPAVISAAAAVMASVVGALIGAKKSASSRSHLRSRSKKNVIKRSAKLRTGYYNR